MKSSPTFNAATPSEALIFIPDISGFTRFVSETEVSHAKHIIEELLEILIDSNEIGLEISEIEGDAILFYRFGKAPTADEMMVQVKKMFERFHLHLKKYERHRICNCGACATAHNLAIKFIAHYGDVSINTIKQYKKLFGKDVIVAHRLLKNDIDSNEYSLFTDNLMSACETWKRIDDKTWSSVMYSENEYDSGKVSFCYVSMNPLLNVLPEPPLSDFSLEGMKSRVLDTQVVINAPMELVFDVIADIPWRSKWIPQALETVTDINSQLAQTGQSHKCIANGPILISHDYHADQQQVTFTETDTKKSFCAVYQIRKLNKDQTSVACTMFLKRNPVKEVMFKLLMKKKFKKIYDQAFLNLKNYCEELVAKGNHHPYRILLTPESNQVQAQVA